MSKSTKDYAQDFNSPSLTNSFTEEKRFFTEPNFQRLKNLQQEIHNLLEMSPSIRKIINSLITDENLEKIKAQLLAAHNE